MCGIAGYINLNGQSISQAVLHEMAEVQEHRGPDARGVFWDHHVGMAHNRLSLLDLSVNGNQPFEDADHVLVYNGEIYNYKELRNALPGRKYRSTSDTEVLFWALKEWGVDRTLQQLRGMFAFAWYSRHDHSLVLARDHLGIKPLFVGREGSTVWFASEVKALLAVHAFEVNPLKVLFSALGVLEKSRYETAWPSIHQVRPGTYQTIREGSSSESTYFSLTGKVAQDTWQRLDRASREDVIAEFDHLFDQSVKRMLISDAPMGAYVSGGIDSSLIAWYAVRQQRQLKLFTANVLGKYSEFSDAQALAQSLRQPLFDYPFAKEMALRDWARVTWHYESPLVVHFNAVPFSNVSGLARQEQVKAVLTGEGSDELFLGYPSLLTRRYDALIRSPFTLLQRLYGLIPKLRSYVQREEGSAGLLPVFEQAAQNFTRQLLREEGMHAYDFLPKKLQREQYLTAQMMQEGIGSLLWRNDRMGMIHSVEARFPFLDEDVVAFAFNLPVKYKIGRTARIHNIKHPFLIDKWIVRKLAEGKLPSSLVNKNKNGFPTYGLRHMSVAPGFFEGGVLANWLELTNAQISYLCRQHPRYHVALLAAVEIWCQLFVAKKRIETVTDRIHQHIQVN